MRENEPPLTLSTEKGHSLCRYVLRAKVYTKHKQVNIVVILEPILGISFINLFSVESLRGRHILRILSAKSNVEFKLVLFLIGPIKGSNRWKPPETLRSEACRPPWVQRQRSPLFADVVRIITAWLGYIQLHPPYLAAFVPLDPYIILLMRRISDLGIIKRFVGQFIF